MPLPQTPLLSLEVQCIEIAHLTFQCHHRVPARDLLPGALFTVAGMVGLRVISVLLLAHWLSWYSTTYGAFGIVIALFFWIILEGTVMILAAALSPALAHRRDLLRGRV